MYQSISYLHNEGKSLQNSDHQSLGVCQCKYEVSPIHSTSLEMSKVSSETDLLLISVQHKTDAAIFW